MLSKVGKYYLNTASGIYQQVKCNIFDGHFLRFDMLPHFALILFIQTMALYKSFTYLLTSEDFHSALSLICILVFIQFVNILCSYLTVLIHLTL